MRTNPQSPTLFKLRDDALSATRLASRRALDHAMSCAHSALLVCQLWLWPHSVTAASDPKAPHPLPLSDCLTIPFRTPPSPQVSAAPTRGPALHSDLLQPFPFPFPLPSPSPSPSKVVSGRLPLAVPSHRSLLTFPPTRLIIYDTFLHLKDKTTCEMLRANQIW